MTQCEIIQDLLPLYHDGACSAASRALVEAHIAGCEECRALLTELEEPLPTAAAPAELERGDRLKAARRRVVGKTALSVSAVFLAVVMFVAGGAALYTAFEEERVIPWTPGLVTGAQCNKNEDDTYSDIKLAFKPKRYLRAECLYRRVTIDGIERDVAIIQLSQTSARKYLDTAAEGSAYVPMGTGLSINRGALKHDVAYGPEYEPEYWNPSWEYRGDLSEVYYYDGINTPLSLKYLPAEELPYWLSEYGHLIWKEGELK